MVSVGIRPNAYGGDGGVCVCVTFDLYFKTHIVHKCILHIFLSNSTVETILRRSTCKRLKF